LNLAKVTIFKISVKIRRYKLSSGVAPYYVKSIVVCMQCVVQNETELYSRYMLNISQSDLSFKVYLHLTELELHSVRNVQNIEV
jgi:hypothetical protein